MENYEDFRNKLINLLSDAFVPAKLAQDRTNFTKYVTTFEIPAEFAGGIMAALVEQNLVFKEGHGRGSHWNTVKLIPDVNVVADEIIAKVRRIRKAVDYPKGIDGDFTPFFGTKIKNPVPPMNLDPTRRYKNINIPQIGDKRYFCSQDLIHYGTIHAAGTLDFDFKQIKVTLKVGPFIFEEMYHHTFETLEQMVNYLTNHVVKG